MHNKIGFNRLGRKSSHRKSLHRNMVTSLIKYERIRTTQPRAKAIRVTAEKLITRAREDSVHNRRIVAKTVYEKDVLNKLFIEIAPRFTERPGGYTRILKLGVRQGDVAEMVLLEFVDEKITENGDVKKKTSRKSRSTGRTVKSKQSEEKTSDKQVNKKKTVAENAISSSKKIDDKESQKSTKSEVATENISEKTIKDESTAIEKPDDAKREVEN